MAYRYFTKLHKSAPNKLISEYLHYNKYSNKKISKYQTVLSTCADIIQEYNPKNPHRHYQLETEWYHTNTDALSFENVIQLNLNQNTGPYEIGVFNTAIDDFDPTSAQYIQSENSSFCSKIKMPFNHHEILFSSKTDNTIGWLVDIKDSDKGLYLEKVILEEKKILNSAPINGNVVIENLRELVKNQTFIKFSLLNINKGINCKGFVSNLQKKDKYKK
jgi:hypothetical protein